MAGRAWGVARGYLASPEGAGGGAPRIWSCSHVRGSRWIPPVRRPRSARRPVGLRSLAGRAWAARCGGGSEGCEPGVRRRSPARRRGASRPGHKGCGRPTPVHGSASASLRHTASRLRPAGGTPGPRASRSLEPASYARTLRDPESSRELGQSPMQPMATAASRVGARAVGRAAWLQALESRSRRGRARGGARGRELEAAGGKVVSPNTGWVRPGGALEFFSLGAGVLGVLRQHPSILLEPQEGCREKGQGHACQDPVIPRRLQTQLRVGPRAWERGYPVQSLSGPREFFNLSVGFSRGYLAP